MKTKITIAALTMGFFCQGLLAQPLVYNAENTGAGFPAPPLPTFADLPVVAPLTDPFAWANGSGRSTSFSDWSRRRNEIKAEIENYEIGRKPNRPADITATYTPGANPATGHTQSFCYCKWQNPYAYFGGCTSGRRRSHLPGYHWNE